MGNSIFHNARIAVDVVMALVYVAVMACALVQEAPHEYLGMALFVLVVVHAVMHRRWFASLARGHYDALRTIRLVVAVGALACIVAQAASAVVLSKHALWFLPALPGAGWARRVHMMCSYWGFVLAFAHAGLQARVPGRLPVTGKWALRIALVAIACLGAWSFVALGMPEYLTGQVQFAFADYGAPLALTFSQYASVALLVAGAFHCIARLLRGRKAGSENRMEERRDS